MPTREIVCSQDEQVCAWWLSCFPWHSSGVLRQSWIPSWSFNTELQSRGRKINTTKENTFKIDATVSENRHEEIRAFIQSSFNFKDQTAISRVVTCRYRLALNCIDRRPPECPDCVGSCSSDSFLCFQREIYSCNSFWMSPLWAQGKSNSNINQTTSPLTWHWMTDVTGNSHSCVAVPRCPQGWTATNTSAGTWAKWNQHPVLSSSSGDLTSWGSQGGAQIHSELPHNNSYYPCTENRFN